MNINDIDRVDTDNPDEVIKQRKRSLTNVKTTPWTVVDQVHPGALTNILLAYIAMVYKESFAQEATDAPSFRTVSGERPVNGEESVMTIVRVNESRYVEILEYARKAWLSIINHQPDAEFKYTAYPEELKETAYGLLSYLYKK